MWTYTMLKNDWNKEKHVLIFKISGPGGAHRSEKQSSRETNENKLKKINKKNCKIIKTEWK